jgi:class 3 adenylate cyclase
VETENWLFSINLENDQRSKTIYLKGQTGYPFQIPITISAKERYLEISQVYKLFWGIYMGIMIFAFLYNLFIFLSLKERTYFYYILYILGSTTFYLGLHGYTFRYLWPEMPELNALLPILICITNIIITLFTIRFLKITKEHKVSFYGAWTIIVGFALIALLNLFAPYMLAIALAQMFSLVTSLFFIYLGFSSWRRNVPTAKFYLIAWTIYLVFVIIFLLTDNNAFPSNFFTRHCIFIGHMTEVLLLSFALADRINWLKRDNDMKQKEIIVQLEKNDKLQREANKLLEQKVEERTQEVVEQRNEALKQQARSDSLLLNILPEATAEELKSTGEAKAKYFESVTVLFADVKDFTIKAERLDPKELVEQINEMFTEFDNIVDKYNVEKIKTIGDAYMAVGGLPSPNNSHASDVVKAAIEFQNAMELLSKKKKVGDENQFKVRIGIHTGPVVAGVVGKKKFAYDIWGSTVNIASRLESSSEVGKINISETTYEHVKDLFDCEERGKIEAKSLGMVSMYFVNH